jgi:hypothetical protein
MSNSMDEFINDIHVARMNVLKLFDVCVQNGKPFEMKVEGVLSRGGRLDIRMFGSERTRVYVSSPLPVADDQNAPPDGGAR